jgi:hypothetical protein
MCAAGRLVTGRRNLMDNERSDSIFIQQGSSSTLRVENEDRWYLVKEEWQGSQLLNSVILGSYNTEQEAKSARNIRTSAAALGKKGGLVRSDVKTNAVRKNGKLGGRPKKKN